MSITRTRHESPVVRDGREPPSHVRRGLARAGRTPQRARAALRGNTAERTSARRPLPVRRTPGRAPIRGETGITLIEILVSVIILSIVVVPVFDAFVRGRMAVARSGERRMALKLVERKAEQLLEAGYGSQGPDANILSVNVNPGAHPDDPSILVNTRGDDDETNDVLGELRWTVTPDTLSSPGGVSVNAKSIEIELRWPAASLRYGVSAAFLLAE